MAELLLKRTANENVPTPAVGYVNIFVNELNELVIKDSSNVNHIMLEKEYAVAVTTSPSDGGHSVTGAGNYKAGEEVVMTAAPAEGSLFVKYADADGNTISEDNPYSFNMPGADVTLVAVFEPEL